MKLASIKPIVVLFFFLTLGVGIYSNTLEAPFYFDDIKNIQDNPHIRLTKLNLKKIVNAAFNSYTTKKRPISYITFALNYYFHQYRLKGYHVVNIIIHILTALFLYLFIKKTLNTPLLSEKYDHPDAIAFFAALMWLAHPLHTQSVTYVVQRMNSMAAIFMCSHFCCM